MTEEKTRESFESGLHEHYKPMFIAGFKYYEGAFVFADLTVGTVLTMKADSQNQHDGNAVAFHFKGKKIGFVPRNQKHHRASCV